MADGIEDVIAEFEAKLKPVTAADLAMAKGETPSEVAVAEPGEAACVTAKFKEFVGVVPASYIGKNIKDLVIEFLESIPECEV